MDGNVTEHRPIGKKILQKKLAFGDAVEPTNGLHKSAVTRQTMSKLPTIIIHILEFDYNNKFMRASYMPQTGDAGTAGFWYIHNRELAKLTKGSNF
jgi:hypothetical protein